MWVRFQPTLTVRPRAYRVGNSEHRYAIVLKNDAAMNAHDADGVLEPRDRDIDRALAVRGMKQQRRFGLHRPRS
jgi:hypothetical protein